MPTIQVLPFEVANLIAAGEVVDRPASAIKEMMENAIDAGAAHITVEIQNGGVTLMRVTDDGCGMSAEDLPMAIRRHATSKIREAKDLDGIFTLGFRGEALAAISSVSDMRIISKRREDPMGAMLEVRGGTLLGVTERGSRDGTTIIVENLFSNVPARRKFLKRDATEAMAVSSNVERVALSHPEIAVRFISDGVTKLETAGDGQLKSAVWAVFGKDFASRLIPLDSEHEGIRITGFVGRSDNVRANRNGQNFFINQRYVRSKTAQAALEQAFVSYIPPEKYPCCVLNITLNPARVDVNVHPAKLEVKFSNEKPVFEAVYYAVRQALEQNTTRPTFEIGQKKPLNPTGGRVSDMTTPIETERPVSLSRRQVTMDMPAPAVTPTPPTASFVAPRADRQGVPTAEASGTHPPQERITAEDYIRYYVNRKKKPGVQTPAAPAPSAPHATLGATGNAAENPAQNAQKNADAPPSTANATGAQPRQTGASPQTDLAGGVNFRQNDEDFTGMMPDEPPMEVLEAEARRMFGDIPLPGFEDVPLSADTADAMADAAVIPAASVPEAEVSGAPADIRATMATDAKVRTAAIMEGKKAAEKAIHMAADTVSEKNAHTDADMVSETAAAMAADRTAEMIPGVATGMADVPAAATGEPAAYARVTGEASDAEAIPASLADAAPYRLVGEVFHSYVIVEQADRMLLIDKHAAHERIIFENLKAKMKDKTVESQLLMIPIDVMLMSEEVGLLDSYRPELEAVGFTYTCLRNTVRVDSIPSGIDAAAVPDMIATMAAGLRAGVDSAQLTRDIFFEKALYQASCKAAIKAGRDYPPEHIRWLVDKLMAIPDITFCPHGRPVAMEMKKRNIDHQFERC